MHSLQVENRLSVAYNEEKVKNVSLCFLCSYVKSGRAYANTREKNVFSKPIGKASITKSSDCFSTAVAARNSSTHTKKMAGVSCHFLFYKTL